MTALSPDKQLKTAMMMMLMMIAIKRVEMRLLPVVLLAALLLLVLPPLLKPRFDYCETKARGERRRPQRGRRIRQAVGDGRPLGTW